MFGTGLEIAAGVAPPDPKFNAPRKPKKRYSVRAVLAHLVKKIIDADRRHRDTQKLLQMPDYLLEDMGINRSDLKRKVHFARFIS